MIATVIVTGSLRSPARACSVRARMLPSNSQYIPAQRRTDSAFRGVLELARPLHGSRFSVCERLACRFGVPQPHRLVPRCGNDALAVGAERRAIHVTQLTVILAQNAPTEDQSGNLRRIESATSHGPCSSRSRAHMRVFARKSAAVDPAATRGLRTRRDAALQPVCPGRSACQRLHVPLPSLP
jgi:hypothetical protein